MRSNANLPYAAVMTTHPPGTISVTFVAQRTVNDEAGYVAAAAAMGKLAAIQCGYLGVHSVRDTNGLGITISYWSSDAHAKAWRDQPDHAAIREAGRDRWYSSYSLHVAEVTRSYDWQKS